jgi:hypothetical protein
MTNLERNILGMLICDNDGIYDALIHRVKNIVIGAATDRHPLENFPTMAAAHRVSNALETHMLAWLGEIHDRYGYEELPWLPIVTEIMHTACYHKLINWNELANELLRHFKDDIEYYERNVKEENWG